MLCFNFNKKKQAGTTTVQVGDKVIVEAIVVRNGSRSDSYIWGVRFRNYDFGENTSAAGWDIFSWIPMIISGCQQSSLVYKKRQFSKACHDEKRYCKMEKGCNCRFSC